MSYYFLIPILTCRLINEAMYDGKCMRAESGIQQLVVFTPPRPAVCIVCRAGTDFIRFSKHRRHHHLYHATHTSSNSVRSKHSTQLNVAWQTRLCAVTK
jgi:hypothetical protein